MRQYVTCEWGKNTLKMHVKIMAHAAVLSFASVNDHINNEISY